MNATPRRQAVIVGLFVTVGVAILGGGILTIGDLNDTFTRKVNVSALFDEVGGLQRGDNIWYAGVKVGVVKTLGFDEGSRVEVEMKIDEEATRVIRGDALARIGSDGFIGSTLVVLHGGTAGAPHLREGDVLAVDKAVSTEDIMTTFQENNTNFVAITSDLKSISANLAAGEGSIGRLLTDDTLYTRVVDAVVTLEGAAANARTLTASLSTFADMLNRDGSLAVEEFQHAGAHASDLMETLALSAANPSTPIGTLMSDEQAGMDLKGTLDNLHLGSRLLAENMEAAQHNFLLRGYFKKKEKAADEIPIQADACIPASAGAGP